MKSQQQPQGFQLGVLTAPKPKSCSHRETRGRVEVDACIMSKKVNPNCTAEGGETPQMRLRPFDQESQTQMVRVACASLPLSAYVYVPVHQEIGVLGSALGFGFHVFTSRFLSFGTTRSTHELPIAWDAQT